MHQGAMPRSEKIQIRGLRVDAEEPVDGERRRAHRVGKDRPQSGERPVLDLEETRLTKSPASLTKDVQDTETLCHLDV